MLKVAAEMDVDKLQRIDELANSVGLCDTPVMMGQWQLQSIVNSPSSFGSWWWQLLGFILSAPTAALLFFSGQLKYCFSLYRVILEVSKKAHVLEGSFVSLLPWNSFFYCRVLAEAKRLPFISPSPDTN